MESRILTEEQFSQLKDQLPEGTFVTYIKLVGIGPNTVQTKDLPELRNMVDDTCGFFLITSTEGLGETLISVVNRFVDKRTQNDES